MCMCKATWCLSTQHSQSTFRCSGQLGLGSWFFCPGTSTALPAFQLKIVFHYIWVDWFLIDCNWVKAGRDKECELLSVEQLRKHTYKYTHREQERDGQIDRQRNGKPFKRKHSQRISFCRNAYILLTKHPSGQATWLAIYPTPTPPSSPSSIAICIPLSYQISQFTSHLHISPLISTECKLHGSRLRLLWLINS